MSGELGEMSKIFISYRRNDAAGYAGRLRDALAAALGTEVLFMDVSDIEPGVDFREALDRALSQCRVVLALIGNGWLDARDEEGHRRLDDPTDFVRREIATALQRNIRVMPLLFDGARMPKPGQLPDELKNFAFRNALEFRHASFPADAAAFIKVLRPLLADDWSLCRGTDPEQGIDACTRIIDGGRELPAGLKEARKNRAEFYRRQRRLDEAIADCNAVLALDADYAATYLVRAQTHKDKGAFDLGIADADKAIAIQPNDARGYDIRATVYRDKGELDLALADYTRAIELNPNYEWPYYNRGFTYSRKGEFTAAIDDYSRAMALDPTLTAAYTQRGVAYEALRMLPEALKDYQQALRVPRKYSTGQWAHDKARERLAAHEQPR